MTYEQNQQEQEKPNSREKVVVVDSKFFGKIEEYLTYLFRKPSFASSNNFPEAYSQGTSEYVERQLNRNTRKITGIERAKQVIEIANKNGAFVVLYGEEVETPIVKIAERSGLLGKIRLFFLNRLNRPDQKYELEVIVSEEKDPLKDLESVSEIRELVTPDNLVYITDVKYNHLNAKYPIITPGKEGIERLERFLAS